MAANLADKIIEQGNSQDNDYEEFGIDELGLPVPKPLNSAYIVARILARSEIFYKVGDTVFVDKKRIDGPVRSLVEVFLLCGEPRIIMWKDEASKKEWRGVSPIIKKEYVMIYVRLLELAQNFERSVIKVTDNLMWNCNKADFIIRGE